MNFSALTFEFSRDPSNKPNQRNKLFIKANFERGDEKGLRYISFFMFEPELKEYAMDHFEFTMNDIGHRLNICGDTITFFDFELPGNRTFGEFSIPFASFEIPFFVRKMVLRIAKRAWKSLEEDDHSEENKYNSKRVNLQFSNEKASRLLLKYGRGTGTVNLVLYDENSLHEEDKKHLNFVERLERLKQIAKNQTNACYQQATLSLSRYRDEYYFQIFTPKGNKMMNGGLINHSRDKEKPDWSIHT